MLNAREIREVRFSKSMSGYKQEEVDVLLDKVEADYEQYERIVADLKAKNEQLAESLEDYKSSQGNIQNVLISAQKFADQIIDEAKTKSAEIIANAQKNIENITAQEKELTTAFDKKAVERKTMLEAEIAKLTSEAESKQAAITKATEDSVARQQMLFDKLKIEIAAFKAEVTAKYKEHLEILSKLPDAVPSDPNEIAAAITVAFDKAPEAEKFVNRQSADSGLEAFVEKATLQETADEPKTAPAESAPTPAKKSGFVVSSDEFNFDKDE